MVHDGPESVYDTLAAAARLADVDAAVRIMRSIGRSGPAASDFVHDAKADRWTMVMRLRQDRDRDGFTATGELLTLGVSNMTYVLEEDDGPVVDPNGPSSHIPIRPVMGTEIWATICPWLWSTP